MCFKKRYYLTSNQTLVRILLMMKYRIVSLLLVSSTLSYSQDIAYQSVNVERISLTRAIFTGKVFSLRKQQNEGAVYALRTDFSTINYSSPPPIEYLLKIESQRDTYAKLLTECHQSFDTDAEASTFFSKMGWNYLSEGDRKEARKRFDWAYLLDENNVDAYWGLGVMTFQEERFEESTLFMEHGVKAAKEKNVTLMVDLATVYIKLFTETEHPKHLSRAFELTEKAIEENPKYTNAYMQKALAELINGKVDEAWLSFHKGHEIAPKESDIHILTSLLSHKPDPKGIFK
ncbi:MAG: tetratricopeptide (TPR) repeat protein [Spirosomataceae bacterium]